MGVTVGGVLVWVLATGGWIEEGPQDDASIRKAKMGYNRSLLVIFYSPGMHLPVHT
jgi:hypothetical protein